MCKAFPCSDYYGDSVAVSDIQGLDPIALRLSDLGNLRLVACQLLARQTHRMRLSSLSAYCGCAVVRFLRLLQMQRSSAPQYGVCNCLPP